ncbi:multidrug ABC transporter ATP-binding protein [Actinoplanes lobatus]|uniref:ABC-2 type transport system ATP-binding protein n=1 Tax=Actinoplanes lobatus TaxID=113568 RepID=A0A7W7MIL7_9ACTN|nr:ATP-binding cassette domain-containing protein [Actinoplanes lobatus]MBB4751546.1 ABC-2 type transport system ATP-binding protein [Actinoplanes lobatus]GGN64612.1 multidrug ABC transporter ATP-binding protein [Actinoplanes lobatus]GIE45949.1 multidrug ABC transporter ATP-binding protein [Actinoplanes lobatus]
MNVTVDSVHKRYGPAVALDGMSFTVEPGRVTGFAGPNGAGKSTTLRVILGLDRPDSGAALIDGRRYRDLDRPLCHVGSLLDAGALQAGRSARNHLLWLAYSQGLPARRAGEVLELTGLAAVGRRAAGGFSLGMRQRLGIAAAMLGDPPVLLLDEPFNGMDPDGIIWMRGFLRSLAAEGRAVLLSSHLMNELEDVADHVVVCGRGRVIADADLTQLLARTARGRITVRTGDPAAVAALTGGGATVAEDGPGLLHVGGVEAEAVVMLLNRAGIRFSEVSAYRPGLEEAYLELTRDAVVYRAEAAR